MKPRQVSLPILLFLAAGAHAQSGLVLTDIACTRDPKTPGKEQVVLQFNSPPPRFPIYAMTDPNRIVADLVDARMKPGLRPGPVCGDLVKKVEAVEKVIGDNANTRIEVLVAPATRYEAYLSENRITLTVSAAAESAQTLPVYQSRGGGGGGVRLTNIDLAMLDKNVRIDVAFSAPPQAASIYMLESPPRIVMDFVNVSAEAGEKKGLKTPPVKSFSIITKPGPPPFTSVVAYLDRRAQFRFQQVGRTIQVIIPQVEKKLATRRGMLLLGAGVLVAGGIAGIIMGASGEEEKPAGSGGGGDLGTPPDFPDY